MPSLLLLGCFAVVVVSLLLHREKGKVALPSPSHWIGLAALAIGIVVSAKSFAKPNELSPILIGLASGAVATCLARLLDAFTPDGSALVALGTAYPAALLTLPHTQMHTAVLSAAVGAAVAAVALGGRSAAIVALFGACVGFAQVMAGYSSTSDLIPLGGATLGLGLALIGLASLALSKLSGKAIPLWPLIAAALSTGLAFFVGKTLLSLGNQAGTLCLAPAAGLVVYWLQGTDKESNPFQLLIATIIWIGLATVAFGLARGFGITLSLLLAVGLLVDLKADRALITAGPLLGLALHRVFRDAHPDVSYAVDIGQHYSLIGFALGALAPLLPEEWLKRLRDAAAYRQAAASILWVALALATPALLALFLAPKGLLGFAIGLGFSGFLAATRSSAKPVVLAFAAGFGALAIVQYDWLSPLTDLSREEKLHWLGYCSGGLAVLSILLYLLQMGVKPNGGDPASGLNVETV